MTTDRADDATRVTGDGSGGVGEVRQLDVHSERQPAWATMPAQDIVRRMTEPDSGGMLRWRRRATVPPVVTIEDKYLTGRLDLRALDFPYLLEFVRCRFEQAPDIRQARLAGLAFTGCWLPGLAARNMSSDNDMLLVDTTVQGGMVDLTDARIKGSLVLTGSRLNHPGQRALHADRLELDGTLLARNLEVVGETRLAGLRAAGNITFSGAGLHNPDGFALDANGLQVHGNLRCDTDQRTGNRFVVTGLVFLASARIESDLSMRGARLRPGGDGPKGTLNDPYYDIRTALIADRISISGNTDLDQGFHSAGTLRMVNARIGGSLRLTGAEVDISAGHQAPYDNHAMYFDGTEIGGDLDARGVRITGQAHMLDINVRGSVRLDGAYLANPGEDALVARRIVVASTFDCREADIYGSVIMQGSRIGANLDLRSTHITKPGRYTRDNSAKPCLDIRAIEIGRDLICSGRHRQFLVGGEIRMHRAQVKREINFDNAELGGDPETTALNAFGAQTQELVLTVGRPPAGRISLCQLRCASLDDNEDLWKATGPIELDGFRYDSLATPIDLKDDEAVLTRLRWLRSAMRGEYSPGPYDQLAAMLRAVGNEEHADTVLIEKQQRRYAALAKGFRVMGPLVKLWSLAQRWMVGYGYRPSRALAWLTILLISGTVWFALHPHPNPITSQDDHLQWNPFLFTLDQLIPIADFGNKNRWALTGPSTWVGATLEAVGWILATTVAAGVTRMLRRT